VLPAQREAPAKGAYSTAAERAFTGGAAGLGQFVRFAGPPALVWAGRAFVRTRGGCSYRWGDAFDCRSTASVRSEGKPIHRARPFAPGAGAPTGWGDAFDCRSAASVRSEVKPIHRARPFAPGAGAPTGGGGPFDCRSTASVRTESNQSTEPALFASGAGAPTGWGGRVRL